MKIYLVPICFTHDWELVDVSSHERFKSNNKTKTKIKTKTN